MSWLNLLWILVVVAAGSWVLANTLIAAFSPLVSQSTAVGVRKHLWAMALLPWLLPVVAVLTLLLLALAKKQGWIYHHCATHLAHHPHFCFEHLPEMALHFANSVVGLLIVISALSLLVFRVIPLYQLYAKSRFFQRLVSGNALKTTLADERPLAFTLGGFKPAIFVSQGLRKLLSQRQLRMVVKHEIAHIRNQDVLKNAVFELCLTLHLNPQRLRAPWYLSSELRADRFVTSKFDSLEFADVLLKLHRAGLNAPFPTSLSGGQLPGRISLLINEGYPCRTPLRLNILYFSVLCFPIALVLNHHGLETVWGWLI